MIFFFLNLLINSDIITGKISPGPAAYEPKQAESGAPKYTMTSRVTAHKGIHLVN